MNVLLQGRWRYYMQKNTRQEVCGQRVELCEKITEKSIHHSPISFRAHRVVVNLIKTF